jgi:hypothetical protein
VRERRGEAEDAAKMVSRIKLQVTAAFQRPNREVIKEREVFGFHAAHRRSIAAPANSTPTLGVTS